MHYIYYNDETNMMYKILEKTFFIYSFIFAAVISTIICGVSIGLNLYLFYQNYHISNDVNKLMNYF
jgi:hypothetical protein